MQHPEYSSILTCQKQFVIVVNVIKHLFYYTILTILGLRVVCDVDFIIITRNILRLLNNTPIVKPGISLYQRSLYMGFRLIHFTVTFAGQTIVDRYTGNIVIPKIVKLGFHCITKKFRKF